MNGHKKNTQLFGQKFRLFAKPHRQWVLGCRSAVRWERQAVAMFIKF